MEAHFHYHIKFIMNVTDIDDKIIKRARLNYLRDQYLDSTPDDSQVNSLPCRACIDCYSTCSDDTTQHAIMSTYLRIVVCRQSPWQRL